jgi:hypothetical protein
VLLVEAVTAGGSAELGGVRVNDVLVAVNGDYESVTTNNTPELFKEYEAALPRPLTISFKRRYVKQPLSLYVACHSYVRDCRAKDTVTMRRKH